MNNKRLLLVLVFLIALLFPVVHPKQVAKRSIPRFGAKPPRKELPRKEFSILKSKKTTEKKKVIPVLQKAVQEKKEVERRKEILIFSCTGGGGHTAVSNGLKGYLKDEYNITVTNVFTDVLGSVDTLGTLTFGKVYGEDFYNFCLRCRWPNLIGKFVNTGNTFMSWRQDAVESLFHDYFKFSKPDLIISVVPVINGGLLVVAEKLNIPFLVLTNDLDTCNYVNCIKKPTYSKFRYTLPFDDPSLQEKIEKACIDKKQIVITGFPLRPEFFRPKDTKAIKKDFDVPEGKPVVMVFMGGAGSLASYRYVRILAKMDMPMHILVCLGRNERLRRNIRKITLPKDVSISIIGFTDRVADLMAISDVLITKPGPGSVCEALESHVPMILDQTCGTIYWEELNVSFMVKHGFGESLKDFKELTRILPKYIKDDCYKSSIKKKMKEFKHECFEKKIQPLIKEMFCL